MLTLYETNDNSGVYYVTCPECIRTIVVYITAPSYCKKCLSAIPDAIDLVQNRNDRILFHRSEKT